MASVSETPVLQLASFEDLVALCAEKREIGLKIALERDVRLVRFEDGRLEINPQPGAHPNLAGDLGRKLTAWTGRRWIVSVSREDGAETIQSRRDAERRTLVDDARADPVVSAILARFPGAEIVDVRMPGDPAAPDTAALPPPDNDDDLAVDWLEPNWVPSDFDD